jgi:hypothetical protein
MTLLHIFMKEFLFKKINKKVKLILCIYIYIYIYIYIISEFQTKSNIYVKIIDSHINLI